jgi:hypothetical protein
MFKVLYRCNRTIEGHTNGRGECGTRRKPQRHDFGSFFQNEVPTNF